MVRTLIVLLFSFQVMAQSQILSWFTHDPRNNESVVLGQSGSIQYTYYKQGRLPDPFVGENEFAYFWMEDFEWELSSNFMLEDTLATYFLSCDWIDTYCSIYVNDELAYEANNAFVPHQFEITPFLKLGANSIKAIFTPPVLFHKEKQGAFTYPAPNDLSDFKTAPLTRKPQYQFGWDWAPRINTIGFLSEVKIQKNPPPTIENYQVVLYNLKSTEASVEFFIGCSRLENQEVIWESSRFGEQKSRVIAGKIARPQIITDPQLWMPNNLGTPYIYKDTWVIKNLEGKALLRKEVKFGLKESSLIYEEDEYGKAYYFKVNGEKVFCKGANYIPQDIFPSRVSVEDVEKMVHEMAAANFNMVRVWGGGYYPMDRFYELCDSLGIMVWQDFMFACAMYPANKRFLENVTKEATFQVKRLVKHPSVVLFNGNNEVDVAWQNWGFQKTYNLDSSAQRQVENDYEEVFKKRLPKIVSVNSEVSYIHTSPLSNWGKPAFFQDGSMHYWGVWHGKDALEDLWKKTGRFNAEYGFQSFPSLSTINTFASVEEQKLNSATMKNHQKSYVGNQMIAKHGDSLFGVSKTFNQFVYKSQLTQALAIGNAILAHRLDFPRCMGTLFWQLNDCWPASTWSSLDYYWNKKALHYEVQKNYASVSVMQDPNEELGNFWIVNDTKEEGYIEVSLEIIKLNGKSRFKTDLGVFFKTNDYKKKVFFKQVQKLNKFKSYLLILRWKDVNGKTYQRRILKKGSRAVPKLKLKDIQIIETKYNPITKKGTIYLAINKFAQQLWVVSKTEHVNFDINFLDLEKGVHVFNYESEVELNLNDLAFFYLNK